MRKITVLVLGLLLCFTVVAPAKSVTIPGFGRLSASKINGGWRVKLPKIGALNFKGEIEGNNIDLKTRITIKKLRRLPAYKALKLMGFKYFTVSVGTSGLILGTRLETRGKLKKLFKTLHIGNPYIDVKAGLSLSGINLEGSLMLRNPGITIPVIPPAGTKIRFSGITIGLEIGKAPKPDKKSGNNSSSRTRAAAKTGKSTPKATQWTPVLSITGHWQIKPSKRDKFLKFEPFFSYNLVSQQIVIGGAMTDTWKDPFGINRIVKKIIPRSKPIILQDVGFDIGWIPGAPTPTKIGMMARRVRIFGEDFGFALDMNPTDGKVAFWGRRKRMGIRSFLAMISGPAGMGFKALPRSMFPQNIDLRDIEVRFAPQGGKVGTLEVKPGFQISGKFRLGSIMSGYVDSYAYLKEGVQIKFGIDNNLDSYLKNKFRKIPGLNVFMSQVTKTFALRKLHILLKASFRQLRAKMHVNMRILGKTVSFTADASLDPVKIAKIIGNKVLEYCKKFGLIVWNNVKKYATKGWNATKSGVSTAAKATYNTAKKFANSVKNYTKTVWKNVTSRVKKFFKVKEWYKPWKWGWKTVWKWVTKTVRKRVRVTKRYSYKQRLAKMQSWAKTYLAKAAEKSVKAGENFINAVKSKKASYKQAKSFVDRYLREMKRYWSNSSDRGTVNRFFTNSRDRRNGYREFQKWSSNYLRYASTRIQGSLSYKYKVVRYRRRITAPRLAAIRVMTARTTSKLLAGGNKLVFHRAQLLKMRQFEAKRLVRQEYLKYAKRHGTKKAQRYFSRNYKKIYNRILRKIARLSHKKFRIKHF